jgi:hypothetical protein
MKAGVCAGRLICFAALRKEQHKHASPPTHDASVATAAACKKTLVVHTHPHHAHFSRTNRKGCTHPDDAILLRF